MTTALQTATDAVKSSYPHANDICRAVGVNPTANDGTVAETWLLGLRDSLLEDLERVVTAVYPQDEINDLEAVPVSTYDQWQIWTELRLWEFEPDIAVTETGEFLTRDFSTETHRMVKLADIPELAQSYEYEIASTALSIMLQDALTAYTEYAETGDNLE